MPRVVGGNRAKQRGSAPTSPIESGSRALRACFEALLTNSDPTCLGSSELECACCVGAGGASGVVDALCAFVLHSEPPRAFFVAQGGLDVLLMASQSLAEGPASGALQILQCLSMSHSAQHCVLDMQPQLLRQIAALGAATLGTPSAAGDREGLQHAAICQLVTWAQDVGSPFCAWGLDTTRAQQVAAAQAGLGSDGSSVSATSRQDNSVAGRPQEGVSGRPSDLEHSSRAQENGQRQRQQQQQQHHQQQQPLFLFVASQALTHPSLPLRRAGARLFASTASAAAACGATAALDACTQAACGLAGDVQHVMDGQLSPAGGMPCFEEFAALGQMAAGAAASPSQHVPSRQKALCHGFLHLVTELAESGNAGLTVLQHAHMAPLLLQAFCCSWGVAPVHTQCCLEAAKAKGSCKPSLLLSSKSAPQTNAQPPPPTTIDNNRGAAGPAFPAASPAIGLGEASAAPASAVPANGPAQPAALLAQGAGLGIRPAAFLQDHQSRELALDALLALLCRPDCLRLLAGLEDSTCSHGKDVLEQQQHAQEEASMQVLLAVVEQLLQQQTAAHVRAALSILGRVQFSSPPSTHTPTAPDSTPSCANASAHAQHSSSNNSSTECVIKGDSHRLGCQTSMGSSHSEQPGASSKMGPGAGGSATSTTVTGSGTGMGESASSTAVAGDSGRTEAGAVGTNDSSASSAWMQLLCNIFDAAWASDFAAQPPQPQQQQQCLPVCAEPAKEQQTVPGAADNASPQPPPPQRAFTQTEPIVLYPPSENPQMPHLPPPPAPQEPIVLYPPSESPQTHLPQPTAPTQPIVLYPPSENPQTPASQQPQPLAPQEPLVLYPPSEKPQTNPPPPSASQEPIVLYPPSEKPQTHQQQGADLGQPKPARSTRRGHAKASGRPGTLSSSSNSSASMGGHASVQGGAVGQPQQQGLPASAHSISARSVALPHGGSADILPAPGLASLQPAVGQGALPTTAGAAAPGPASLQPAAAGQGSSHPVVATGGVNSTQQGSEAPHESVPRAVAGPHSEVLLDLGLGYRVLVQVLQAWKQLLDSRQGSVLAALNTTGWRARAHTALSHPKQLVVNAASKLLQSCDALLDEVEAQACLQQLGQLQAADGKEFDPHLPPTQLLDHLIQEQLPLQQQQQQEQQAQVEWSNEAFAAALDAMHLSSPPSLDTSSSGLMPMAAGNGDVQPVATSASDGPGTGAIGEDMQEFLQAFLASDTCEGSDSGTAPQGGAQSADAAVSSGTQTQQRESGGAQQQEGSVGATGLGGSGAVDGKGGYSAGGGSGGDTDGSEAAGSMRAAKPQGTSTAPSVAKATPVAAPLQEKQASAASDPDAAMFLPLGSLTLGTAATAEPGVTAAAPDARTAAAAAAAEQEQEQELADALTLLPDFDQVARNTLLQQASWLAAAEGLPLDLDVADQVFRA